MPNKINIQKWYNALMTSGRPQTTGTLRDENGFCCLGVGSDIASEEGVCNLELSETYGMARYDGASAYFPASVADWFGLAENPDVTVKVDGEDIHVCLSDLNDDHEWTFEQIAQALKENYLEDK